METTPIASFEMSNSVSGLPYSESQLLVALTLQAHRQVEVSLVNPRRARHFAQSLGERSKTDPVDAGVLCEYAARMPWVA